MLKLQKLNEYLNVELENLKIKVIKLKARKNFDTNKKLCQYCTKEFNESENLNWSCCTHRSEWGGDMWWCCGKTKKNSPGCKFQKHVSMKEDGEDDEEIDLGKIAK